MLLLVFAGCGGEEERLKVKRDIANLQEQIYQLERNQAEAKRELAAKVDAMSVKLSDRTSQANIQDEIFSLRESLAQYQAVIHDLDNRVSELSRGQSQVATAPMGTASSGLAPVENVPGNVVEQQFIQASLDLDRGKHNVAILGFEEILKSFPDSPYTERAHYYLGKSYFEIKDYQKAGEQCRLITTNYPKGDFVKQAMYYEGQCYYYLNQYSKAINTLRDLIQFFPGTQEAELARQFLKKAGYEK